MAGYYFFPTGSFKQSHRGFGLTYLNIATLNYYIIRTRVCQPIFLFSRNLFLYSRSFSSVRIRVSKAYHRTWLLQFAHTCNIIIDAQHSLVSNCMKPLVLRACILCSYVPLRAESKRERVANELCCVSIF